MNHWLNGDEHPKNWETRTDGHGGMAEHKGSKMEGFLG
jgi:hypothetical protein